MNDVPSAHKVKVNFHTSVFAKLRAYFLAGILVTAPIAITLYATWFLLRFIDTQVSSLIPEEYLHKVAVPGMGLLIAVAFFIVVGASADENAHRGRHHGNVYGRWQHTAARLAVGTPA